MSLGTEIWNEFYGLADYLAQSGAIADAAEYFRSGSALISFVGHLRAYQAAIPFCRDARVLEVGAFLGYGARMLAGISEQVVAVDRDLQVLAWARRRGGPRIDYVAAERFPFSGESFDVVSAFQVIEHIPPREVTEFLAATRRVLRPGGRLLLTTPNRRFRLRPFQRPFNRDHFQEYTSKKLMADLQTVYVSPRLSGFRAPAQVEEVERKRVRLSPLDSYVRFPLRRLLSSLERRPRGGEVPAGKSCSEVDAGTISLEDFYLEDDNLDEAMAFFAVCVK